MAFSFFKSLGISPFISNTEIHVKSKKVLNEVNCIVNNLRFSKDELFFQILEKSLPFPASAYPKDTTLIPFNRMFNQEILSVKGLTPEGKYELTIDTTVVAEYTGKQLGAGINLALSPSTPQMQQSERIAILNEKMRQMEVQLRDMKLVEYKIFNPDEQLLGKAEKSEILNQRLKMSEGKSWSGYYKMIFKFYVDNSDKKEEKVRAIGQLVKDIYKKNKPLTHNYILKKIASSN